MPLLLPDQPLPPAVPGSEDTAPAALAVAPAVKAKFASPLKLTDELARNFDAECLQRIEELRREMGLTVLNEVIPGSWMWLRKTHEQYFQGDLSWRLAFGNIFLKQNITLGSGLRHVRYLSARVQDDLLGTSPFMSALAVKQSKEALAKQVEELVQVEIEASNVRSSLREGQKIALYRNECVIKTGYIQDSTPYVGEATVLVDVATGLPITTPEKGLFIYEDDDFIKSPTTEGLMLLENDPSFTVTDHPEEGFVIIPASGDQPERIGTQQYFAELPQVLVKKEGVYANPLDYRSLLCPLKVESIHDADTVVHLYLETPSRLNKVYGGIDVSQNYFSFWNQPGQDKPKYEQGENDQIPTAIFQQVIVAEVYRRCDPDKTGEDKEVLAVFDLTNQRRIYHNYLANHMPKRPFDVIPGVEKVPGRWYGRGIYGMLDCHLFYEDVEASRSFFKNSMDATIQVGYQAACDSWKNGQPPVIGSGDTYWLNENWDPEGKKQPLARINLNEHFEPDVELMNTMRQSADSLVGAISTQSANQSNFDQSKTATGNQLVQQASDVITKATELDQTDAINAILAQVVDVILEHMDKKKLMADPETGIVATINQREARSISRDVRLLLTRSKSTQLLNTSKDALVIAKDYHALKATDPQQAKDLRDLYVAQLKGLEVQNADSICPEISDEEIAAWQQSQQQGQPAPVSHSISAKLENFLPSERPQAVAQFGIHPGTPQEAQAVEQQAAAEEAAAKAAQPIHALPSA